MIEVRVHLFANTFFLFLLQVDTKQKLSKDELCKEVKVSYVNNITTEKKEKINLFRSNKVYIGKCNVVSYLCSPVI